MTVHAQLGFDYLIHTGTTIDWALTLLLDFEFGAMITIDGGDMIKFRITTADITQAAVKDSKVPGIDVDAVRAEMTLAIKLGATYVQTLLDKFSIPLPTFYGVKLVNPVISFNDGYFSIGSGVTLNHQFWEERLTSLANENSIDIMVPEKVLDA
jgi:hypothetical protein